MKKTAGWVVSEWGRVSRQLRELGDYDRALLKRTGSLYEYWFPDEQGAQQQAIKNADVMLAKVRGYRDAAVQRLGELL